MAGERREALVSQVLRREREHQIVGVLNRYGFSEPDFDVQPAFKLVHKLTEESFDFQYALSHDGAFVVHYSRPGTLGFSSTAAIGFVQAIEHLNQWCAQLRDYLKRIAATSNLPDLFVSASSKDSAMQALALEESVENSPFSTGERGLIVLNLELLADHIKKDRELTTEQFQILDRQMKYLTEASARLGRKDWLNIFFNILVSFAIAGVFAPDRVNEMIRYGAALFQFLLNPSPLLP